jgi:xanthine dehydrogenase molybdenum-binding subunit
MSVGYALSEEIAFDPSTGKAMNPILSDYWWPTSLDMPPTDIIFSEVIDPVGPLGAKAIGETPSICPHAAIASAVYNAAGIRIKQLPLTPDVVLRALGRIR